MWVRIASGRRARRRSQRCFKLPAPVRPCDTPGGAHVCQAGGGGGGGHEELTGAASCAGELRRRRERAERLESIGSAREEVARQGAARAASSMGAESTAAPVSDPSHSSTRGGGRGRAKGAGPKGQGQRGRAKGAGPKGQGQRGGVCAQAMVVPDEFPAPEEGVAAACVAGGNSGGNSGGGAAGARLLFLGGSHSWREALEICSASLRRKLWDPRTRCLPVCHPLARALAPVERSAGAEALRGSGCDVGGAGLPSAASSYRRGRLWTSRCRKWPRPPGFTPGDVAFMPPWEDARARESLPGAHSAADLVHDPYAAVVVNVSGGRLPADSRLRLVSGHLGRGRDALLPQSR